MSDTPRLAGYCVSMSPKVIIEPSAPPPLVCGIMSLYSSCEERRSIPRGTLGQRKPDCIVESETNGLANFFATLTAIEKVFLEAVDDREQRTTGNISRSMDTVGARYSASQRSCMYWISQISKLTRGYGSVPLVTPTEATRTTSLKFLRNIARVVVIVSRIRERRRSDACQHIVGPFIPWKNEKAERGHWHHYGTKATSVSSENVNQTATEYRGPRNPDVL